MFRGLLTRNKAGMKNRLGWMLKVSMRRWIMFTGPKFRVVDEIFVLTNQTNMGTIQLGKDCPTFFSHLVVKLEVKIVNLSNPKCSENLMTTLDLSITVSSSSLALSPSSARISP